MRTLTLSICLAFAFFVASAEAQVAPGGSPGTRNSSPTMSQPGNNPGQAPGMDQSTANQNTTTQNSEHKVKGCVQSQGGEYVLETKKGKDIALTGEDVSAHVGHEVALTGTWEKNNGMSSTSSNNAGTSSKSFNVSNVKMISETCKGKMSSGTGNTGTGQSGTGTQPPQK
jgi:Protein of unknown function (DUF5818)